MKGTRRPKAGAERGNVAGVRAYRAAAATPTETAPVLKALAEAALAALSRAGEKRESAGPDGPWAWSLATKTKGGAALEVGLTGPDLPATIPSRTAHPSDIPKDRAWRGTHRLKIAAPRIALDLCWREGAALRIYQFSRGEWEHDVVALASTGGDEPRAS